MTTRTTRTTRLEVIALNVLFLIVIHLYFPIAPIKPHIIWLGMPVIVLISVVHLMRRHELILPTYAIAPVLFLALTIGAALFRPPVDAHLFVFENAGFVAGLLLFLALHQFRFSADDQESLLFVLFLAGALQAAFALLQLMEPAGSTGYLPRQGRHPDGTFAQANLFASFVATAAVISLFLISSDRFGRLHWAMKAGFYLLVTLIIAMMLESGSRVGVFGTLVGCVVLLATRWRMYGKRWRATVVWGIAATVAIALLAASDRSEGLERIGAKAERLTITASDTEEIELRVPIYRTAWTMFRERPLLGHGSGGWRSAYPHHLASLNERFPENKRSWEAVMSSAPLNHPHNELLYRLVESGLAGGLGLLAMAGGLLVMLIQLGLDKGGGYAAMLMPIAIHTQVELPLYHSVGHWFVFLFLVYLPSSHFCRTLRFKLRPAVQGIWVAGVIALFLLTESFLSSTIRAQIGISQYLRAPRIDEENSSSLLDDALHNAYLQRRAIWYLMTESLNSAKRRGDSQALMDYVVWSRTERRLAPSPKMYTKEINALRLLGRGKEARILLDERTHLYPATLPAKRPLRFSPTQE